MKKLGWKLVSTSKSGPMSGFDFGPYLPQGDRPGKWTPKVAGFNLKMCDFGWHFLRSIDKAQAFCSRYLIEGFLYRIEWDGEAIHDHEKSVAQTIRFLYPVYMNGERRSDPFRKGKR